MLNVYIGVSDTRDVMNEQRALRCLLLRLGNMLHEI